MGENLGSKSIEATHVQPNFAKSQAHQDDSVRLVEADNWLNFICY